MAVDSERLVVWLRERAAVSSALVIKAVYLGLVARVQHGEFDEESK